MDIGSLACRNWKHEPSLTKFNGSCAVDSAHIDFGIRWDNNSNKGKVHHDGLPAVRVDEPKRPKPEEPPIPHARKQEGRDAVKARANEPSEPVKPVETPLPILVILPDGTVIRKDHKGPVDWDKK